MYLNDAGIIGKLIYAFYDSPYITIKNYQETLNDLLEVFYYYKNEISELCEECRYNEMLNVAQCANKTIPNNIELIGLLAFALTSGENDENIDEAITLNKLILEKSVDDILRYRAIASLCRLYAVYKSDKTQALYYVKQLPKGYFQTSSYLIQRFDLLEDGEKEMNYRFLIHSYTTALTETIYWQTRIIKIHYPQIVYFMK